MKIQYESLAEYKKETKKTYKQIAKELGISKMYVYKLVVGERFPSRKLALKISKKYNIPILNLLYPKKSRRRATGGHAGKRAQPQKEAVNV